MNFKILHIGNKSSPTKKLDLHKKNGGPPRCRNKSGLLTTRTIETNKQLDLNQWKCKLNHQNIRNLSSGIGGWNNTNVAGMWDFKNWKLEANQHRLGMTRKFKHWKRNRGKRFTVRGFGQWYRLSRASPGHYNGGWSQPHCIRLQTWWILQCCFFHTQRIFLEKLAFAIPVSARHRTNPSWMQCSTKFWPPKRNQFIPISGIHLHC